MDNLNTASAAILKLSARHSTPQWNPGQYLLDICQQFDEINGVMRVVSMYELHTTQIPRGGIAFRKLHNLASL